MARSDDPRWLLLIHQIPPKPNYLRVKVWRRLQRLGAVAIKNSVYVLPRSDQTQEDFHWIQQQIVKEGGDASVCEARFVEGVSDEEVEALFRTARAPDYLAIRDEAGKVMAGLPASKPFGEEERGRAKAGLARLRNRLAEVAAIDFFSAPERDAAAALVSAVESRLKPPPPGGPSGSGAGIHPGAARGRTWVTRKGIQVDRIASAWLIRRFIDPEGRFKFVAAKGYRPEAGELRFDMFEAEFTHEGERCTFEVLVDRFRLTEPALGPIAAIVHDIDLKDGKFARPETAGLDRLIKGLTVAHKEDEERLRHGMEVFDDLCMGFRRGDD